MPGMSPRPGLLPGEGRELLIPGRLWPEKGKKKRRDEGEGIRLQQSEFVTKRETSPSLRIRRKRRPSFAGKTYLQELSAYCTVERCVE